MFTTVFDASVVRSEAAWFGPLLQRLSNRMQFNESRPTTRPVQVFFQDEPDAVRAASLNPLLSHECDGWLRWTGGRNGR